MSADNSVTITGIDKHVSSLALGTAFYRLDTCDAWFDILDTFLELGGTVIDTGRCYIESEEVIGRWMESRGVRDEVVLMTKGGHGNGLGVESGDFAATIEEELATSLERLRTGYADMYMLHRDSPTVPAAEIMDCLNTGIKQGKTHSLGASNWEYDRITEANAYAHDHNLAEFSIVSNNITLAVPEAPFYPGLVWVDARGEEWHRKTGIPLVIWSSQARGFFTGRFTPDTISSEDEFTTRMVEVYWTEGNIERLRRAECLGKKKGGYSATQIALAWLLHKPFPLIPIVGAHSPSELKSCFQALSIQLTPQETTWLNLEI
jgi:aryl-alcohol dehydrogenase-like predicted oxidoreductase